MHPGRAAGTLRGLRPPYARSLGELEGTAACASMLDRIREVPGEVRAGVFHSHFSKIQFTPNGGEKMHLTFAQDDFGPDPPPLMAGGGPPGLESHLHSAKAQAPRQRTR